MPLLDPKVDVVFRMLFAQPRNERLLVALLTAVLRPTVPIAHAKELDPELPCDLVTDRGVRLDVLVELEDGRLVDVEIQCDPRGAPGARWLYHWSRLYSGRLRRGGPYDDLAPVVCVVFLDAKTDARRFHSTYRVLEVHDHSELCGDLEVHVVQLPRLDDRALELLANEDPIMAEAKEELEIPSRQPSARRLAQMRRDAEIERRLDRAADLAEGRAEGRAEACAKLRETLVAAIAKRGRTPLPHQRARIDECDELDQLTAWLSAAWEAPSLDALFQA